jgi:hypothetical protein
MNTPALLSTAALLATALVCAGCSDDDDGNKNRSVAVASISPAALDVDASAVVGELNPLWRDHYDLSFQHEGYANEPGLPALINDLKPRSWRCSVGRWEVGFTVPFGDSLDPAELARCEREFYRGPNTLGAADDPSNYDFTYLDAQLEGLLTTGAEPYLCFDYMPFTLSSQQNPRNANNMVFVNPALGGFTFSNGIRTAPPASPTVYARVVRNVIRHVRGLFGSPTGRDFGVTYFEVGNEVDLLMPVGPNQFAGVFWTGTAPEWIATYQAIASEVTLDGSLPAVKIGGGSFAMPSYESSPTYVEQFLSAADAASTRLDFLSYHSYSDDPQGHRQTLQTIDTFLRATSLTPELINGEWGRELPNGLSGDPVYSTIEHGLFRAEVMTLMQEFDVKIAHEALIRDPAALPDSLGLLSTGPAAHKPVSQTYLGLGLLNDTLDALQITAPTGLSVLAGRNAGGTKVVVAHVVSHDGADADVDISIRNLPWGAGGFTLNRYEVTESGGLQQVEQASLSGGEFRQALTVGGNGVGRLVVWELIGN